MNRDRSQATSRLESLTGDGYRTVARNASVALFLVDADGVIVDANPATAQLLGRSEEDLPGLTLSAITHPADLEASRARLAEAINDGVDVYRVSKRYIRGDGTPVLTDLCVSPLRDDHGVPVGFLATAFDDTRRAEAAARARSSDALLRATVDSFLDPWVYLVAVRDDRGLVVDFRYADANKAASEHNGLPREQLLETTLLSLLPEHAGERLEQYVAIVETRVALAEDDVPFVTRGETRYFSNRAVAVGCDGVSLTWRDTTEQVRLRRELTTRAGTDPLTGLLNRAGLAEAADGLARLERRASHGAAVLYVDLDGLGQVNRRHGHPGGDAVLAAVADRLAGAVRSGDVVARVGGDEFVVLAPGADDDGAGALAVKLADAVSRPLRLRDGQRVVPTITVGVTVGEDVHQIHELIARADAAMLVRKRQLYDGTDRYLNLPS